MPRKRGQRGSGGITKRPGGKVQAQWSRTQGGRRIRQSATFAIRDDAEWWLDQAKRTGSAPDVNLSVAEYLARWLASIEGTIAASTWRSYTGHVRMHIVPVLGDIRVTALLPRDVEVLMADRRQAGLSPTTVRLIVTTLRIALGRGVKRRELPDNAAADVTLPRPAEPRIEPLTDVEADRLVDAVLDTWMGPLVRFLLGTGLRLGEALSLNQGDLILDAGYVRLRTSKTHIRAVPVTDDGVEALREALADAPRRGKAEPVFFGPKANRAGQRDRLRGSSVSHAVPRVLTAAGLDRLTPHGLRHGLATLMAGKGASLKLIGDQLGHLSPAMTNRYAHIVPEAQRAALQAAGRPVRKR